MSEAKTQEGDVTQRGQKRTYQQHSQDPVSSSQEMQDAMDTIEAIAERYALVQSSAPPPPPEETITSGARDTPIPDAALAQPLQRHPAEGLPPRLPRW